MQASFTLFTVTVEKHVKMNQMSSDQEEERNIHVTVFYVSISIKIDTSEDV